MGTNLFLDEYIHLEKLCNDMYGTHNGISSYIEDMERTPHNLSVHIMNWDMVYRNLKHLRWVRNKLVHDGEEIYKPEDIRWLSDFYQSIMNGKDPLTQSRIMKESYIKPTWNIKQEDIYHVEDSHSIQNDRTKNKYMKGTIYLALIILIFIILFWWL